MTHESRSVTQTERWLDRDALMDCLDCSGFQIEAALIRGLPYATVMGEERFKLSEVQAWIKRRGRTIFSRRQRATGSPKILQHGRPCSAWLYAIQAGNDGNVKLGLAANPILRLRNLQTGSPELLRGIAAWRIDSTWEEVRLHRHFARYRLHGEWFRPAPELLELVQRLGGNFAWGFAGHEEAE